MNDLLIKTLENDNHELRAELCKVFKDPIFIPRYTLNLEEERLFPPTQR